MMYLTNAFSLNMLVGNESASIIVTPLINGVDARSMLRENTWVDAVGHQDTAELFGNILNLPVRGNRMSLQLAAGDELVVGQYIGPRLPEGTSVLPEGATINWLHVQVCGDILSENDALKRQIKELKAQCQEYFECNHLAY